MFVIELKAPTIALRIEHLQQLKTYMRKVREFLKVIYAGSREEIVVEGALIGTMPKPDTKSDAQRDLIQEVEARGPLTDWEVIGLTEALRRTERVHSEMLEALNLDEEAGLAGEGQKTDGDTASLGTVIDITSKLPPAVQS